MTVFQPNLAVLPENQRQLWPMLEFVPRSFVLYGGTGLALRLAHRQSVDFDFFSATGFEPEALHRELSFAREVDVLQKSVNTLTIRTAAGVRLSFFGGLTFGQVDWPERCAGNGIFVASLRDLLATKLNTVYQRAESKDYLDIDAALRAGISLAIGLGCARAIYRNSFNPMLPLKALTYFEDGDLRTLPPETRRRLAEAVAALAAIPSVRAQCDRITTPEVEP
jgi:hypothetical protein